jgi:hypothetical protein
MIDGQTTSTYMTTDTYLKPNFTISKIDKHVDLYLNETCHLIDN